VSVCVCVLFVPVPARFSTVPVWFAGSPGDILSKFLKGCVFIDQGESISSPCLRAWINFSWFYKGVPDLESVASPDANYFVTNARLRAASPTLLVYCYVAFACNLPVTEAVMPKLCW